MDRIVSSSHDRTSLLSTHKVLRNTYFLLNKLDGITHLDSELGVKIGQRFVHQQYLRVK